MINKNSGWRIALKSVQVIIAILHCNYYACNVRKTRPSRRPQRPWRKYDFAETLSSRRRRRRWERERERDGQNRIIYNQSFQCRRVIAYYYYKNRVVNKAFIQCTHLEKKKIGRLAQGRKQRSTAAREMRVLVRFVVLEGLSSIATIYIISLLLCFSRRRILGGHLTLRPRLLMQNTSGILVVRGRGNSMIVYRLRLVTILCRFDIHRYLRRVSRSNRIVVGHWCFGIVWWPSGNRVYTKDCLQFDHIAVTSHNRKVTSKAVNPA